VSTHVVYGEDASSPEASNLRGQVFRVYDGAGLEQSDAYDFKGNLIAQTRRLTQAYDTTPEWSALEGLSSIADLDATADALLELEALTTAASFDALGRPITQTTPDASLIELGYDEGGSLRVIAANVRGVVTSTEFVTSIEYDAKGQRQRIAYGNGTQTEYAYEPQTFRLSRMHTTAGAIEHQDLRYTYDPVGNITEIRDLAQPVVFTSNAAVSGDQRFVYDALYRLVDAEGREHESQGQPTAEDFVPRAAPDDPTGLRGYAEHYVYDLVGNILEMQHVATGGNWTRRYAYANSNNRLLATSAPGDAAGVFSHAYAYNEHGSMSAMPNLAAIDWDHAERMQSADLGGGGTVHFLYDAAGNRVRKVRENQAGTSSWERIYIGGYEVYRERVGGELRLERQTLHIADDTGRICMVETKTIDDANVVEMPANTSRYQYGNHLGSVGMELDEAGQLISYEEFHPYGTSAYRAANSAVDVSASRYRYTGRERDEETGLGHHGARYYASWLGRWTAADPIGLGDGVNRFAYARGSPTTLADPGGTRAFAPGDPDDPSNPGEVDANYGTGFSAEEQRALDTSTGDAKPTRGRPISEKYAEERAIAEVDAAFIEEYVEVLSADYEVALRAADAERMQAERRMAEQLGGLHVGGRIVSDFGPGQVRGPDRVDTHASDLRMLARRLHAQPFEDRLAALEARNERAVAGIDGRADTLEDLLLLDAALGMGGVVAGARVTVRPSTASRPKALPVPKARPAHPRTPAPEHGTFHVDPQGNTIPTPKGGSVAGSPNGRYIQAKDAAGNPTGVRIDGPHNAARHPDPASGGRRPHAHVPGITTPNGEPWLPLKGGKR